MLDPSKFLDLVQGAFRAYKGVRIVALGETGVGKTTFWRYAEEGKVGAETEPTAEVEHLGKFAVRDMHQNLVRQRVRAVDVPGHMWDTWRDAIATSNPNGIVIMCDHAPGATQKEPDTDRLARHVEVLRHVTQIVEEAQPSALDRIVLVVNKSDLWKHSHSIGELIEPSGIYSQFSLMGDQLDVSTAVRDSSALYGDNVKGAIAFLAGN